MSLLEPLLPLLPLLDAQNIFAPFRQVLAPAAEPSADFTILVPLYGDPSYFRNEAYLARYRANVLLVVNVAAPAMRAFAAAKRAEGWRVCEIVVPRQHSPAEMVIRGLAEVETAYAIRMDGDTESDLHPGRAVAAMHEAGADFCSVKVLPGRRTTLVERMQGVEYDMAMLSRHNRPWLTSGACMMGRTDAFRQIMSHHSLYFFGEDVETGRIAKYLGMRVRHIDFTVRTEVPEGFRALFRQRVGWWCGAFRTSVINADKNLRFPLWSAYYVVLVWLYLAGKVTTTASVPTLLPTLLVVYTALTFLANWSVRSRWMLLVPYYALLQALVMPAFGLARFLRLLVTTRRAGRYRISTLRSLTSLASRWTPAR